ncbi:hypothetical protein [Halomonas denitrificans]|nr:hypothetical protein [Halomonas denitrificans]
MSISAFFAHPFVLAAGGALVTGAVGWVTLKYRMGLMEKDLDEARKRIANKNARIAELEKSISIDGDETNLPVARKSAVVSVLNDILDHAGAERATFYVPAHNDEGAFLGLIVLATAPTDISDQSFIGTVFAGRDSKAVTCYLTGETLTAGQSAFSIDRYRPSSLYCECLQTSAVDGSGSRVGVIQLLSGQALDPARAADAVNRFRPALLDLADSFFGTKETNLEIAGLSVPRDSKRGSVISMDISNSSALFADEARSFTVRKFMGEFLRAAVEAIDDKQGTFESFTGDGFIAVFADRAGDRSGDRRGNRPGNGSSNCAVRALACATAVNGIFADLIAQYRQDLAHLDVRLFARIGVSTGTVHPIVFSFGQLRTASVIGRTPSLAKRVCDTADRDRTVLQIDEATFFELPGDIQHAFAEIVAPDARLGTNRLYRHKGVRTGSGAA